MSDEVVFPGPAPEVPPIAPEPEPQPEAPPPPPPPAPEGFGAGKAFATFALMMLAQFMAGFAVIMVALIVAAIGGQNIADTKVIDRLTREWQGALLLVAVIFSTIVVLVMTRIWAWDLARDRTDGGIGMRRIPAMMIALYAALGVLIALAYLGMTRFVPFDPTKPVGPLTEIASSGGWSRVILVLVALLYAPAIEEFLFRGLLLNGFSRTWGVRTGGAVVTVLFVLMHLTETWNYWPGTLAIATMAVATLIARIRTGSLAAPVALHFAYNAMVMTGVFSL